MNQSSFYLFFILFYTVLFVQCTQEDTQSCLTEPAELMGAISNCDSFPFNTYICEHSYGGKLELNELSKEYLPWYCDQKGVIRKFVNNSGQINEFILIQKSHQTSLFLYNTFQICASDSTKFIGMCIDNEVATTEWISSEPDMNFHITVRPKPEFLNGELVGHGDFLLISRSGNTFSRLEFQCIIHQNTLSSPRVFGQRFYDILDLEGKKYTNIITEEGSPWNGGSFLYYYNKERGLVAFKDNNDVTWHLQE